MVKGKALIDEEFEKAIQIRAKDIRDALDNASEEEKELIEDTTIQRKRGKGRDALPRRRRPNRNRRSNR